MSNTTAETHVETSKPGMPQLDPTYFASQIFWLGATFVVMYVVMAKLVIPRIGRVIESREAKIASDIAAAQTAKADAQAAIAAYEKDLAAARDAANTAISEAQRTISEKAAKEQGDADAKLAAEVAKAEQQIAVKLADAQSSLKPITAEIAQAMVDQVFGEAANAAPAPQREKMKA